jgi:phage-related minor tail protein
MIGSPKHLISITSDKKFWSTNITHKCQVEILGNFTISTTKLLFNSSNAQKIFSNLAKKINNTFRNCKETSE